MLRTILIYGAIAGLVVAIPMNLALAFAPDSEASTSHITKRYRDRTLGGVIKFLPALLIGLGISAVAGVIYVIGWEISLAATNHEFIDSYTQAAIAAEQAKGVSGADLEAFIAEMEQMRVQYANPLFRLPITFIEIFPVGVLVSLITAALLRNSRFLPARQAATD